MTTQITQHNPARTDLVPADHGDAVDGPSRRWALAGVGAALAGIAGLVASYGVNAVYDKDVVGDADGIAARLADQANTMVAFHVLESIAAVLLAVFAVGLHHRLRTTLPDSSTPGLAAFGLLGTSVVMVMATGLDTEFAMGVRDGDMLVPATAAMYNHWLATIPGVWILAGLSGLAVFAAARQGGAPRWIGRVGLALGGFTLLVGISPLQYLAVMPGLLMVLVLAIGFAVGDRAGRS